ncbi:MAG: thiamine pyrophosphate-dependent enzyme [Chitinophagales bacterium]|nr:thiamine pyrophosphate-dependent enzyme [Chitinophagales bacterium]
MSPAREKELAELALKVREHIIKLSTDGGCFIGASLSCADLIVYLYSEFLRLDKNDLQNPDRDYLFLSKGHDVPALYGTLAELGFMERERLNNHLKANDHIYWHPNRNIPAIEFHSGSLGHLPSVALGVALDLKMKSSPARVIVITGDGELNEGSVWEAVMVANAYQLNNLTFVVDRNHFQANMATEDLIPLEPLQDKFAGFGCKVQRINGHDFQALETAFKALPFSENKLNVIIADTVRGKGLPSIEARADRWFCNFTHEEIDSLLKELHGQATTELVSETLTVR